jgi:hypothetical protein
MVSRLLARAIRPQRPALLIVSLPRSGSSWVGHILGLSSSALYLREPINVSYLASGQGTGASCYEVDPHHVLPIYRSSADAAFAGLPAFQPPVVRFAHQWPLVGRREKRVVIKEVNPLAVEWIARNYRPRIIYLIRHPAAVARSWYSLGWTVDHLYRVFSAATLDSLDLDLDDLRSSFWREHGALQALVLRECLNALNYTEHRVVRYEDLCIRPVELFRELFRFGQLDWSDQVEAQIIAQSKSQRVVPVGQPGVFRNSRARINRWKTHVSRQDLGLIKESYLSFDPPYYAADEWD